MKVSPNDTLCIGETTNLNASQANTYLWSPSAGLSTTTSASTTATPSITTNTRWLVLMHIIALQIPAMC
ncbi:MAG: hypothetical protein WDM90_24625 [Ferruginibacter sp.]